MINSKLEKQDIDNLRFLLKIVGIRSLDLSYEEMRSIVPDQKKLGWEEISEAEFAFDPREIWVTKPHSKGTRRWSFSLEDQYPMPIKSGTYEEHVYQHYEYLFKILEQNFGTEWIIQKMVDKMTKRYDAISAGQAEAVIKKFVPVAREDGETLSSTARTQLHRLRAKLSKYRQLVDAFDQLMMSDSDDLKKLADQKLNPAWSGPFYIEGRGVIGADKVNMADMFKEAGQTHPLQKTPESTRYGSTTKEIEMTRLKLKEKGYDPDAEAPKVDVTEEIRQLSDVQEFFFLCTWPDCFHKEEFETNDMGEIIQKYHHDRPMALRLPRTTSDY